MSLRLKLLLAAGVLLLAVPVAGYRFVLETEAFLRDARADGARTTARVVAQAIGGRPDLLPRPRSAPAQRASAELYAHPFPVAPTVDGYDGDWGSFALPTPPKRSMLRAAQHGERVYLLIGIADPVVTLREPVAGAVDGDHVRLILEDAPGFRRAWRLETGAPGRMRAVEVPPEAGDATGAPDPRIEAALRSMPGGYRIELSLPRVLLGRTLSIERVDADPGVRRRVERIPADGGFSIALPSAALGRFVDALAPAAGTRIRIVDASARVLAETGGLAAPVPDDGLARVAAALLPPDDGPRLVLSTANSRLSGPEIEAALGGRAESRWRTVEAGAVTVVSATYPLRDADRVVGAVVVEESASPIRSLGRAAMFELFTTAALAFALGGGVVLVVAGRMAARLRGLRDRAAGAVDASGRIVGRFSPPSGRDEIGDLGRSFAAAFDRLHAYNDYLEQLARRLSHELRTPIAVIRSSLDNLAMTAAPDDGSAVYRERARDGVERLDALVRRMSEAARLEQALADTELERFDLAALARAAAEAHVATWPRPPVEASLPHEPVMLIGAPDLMLQALDKLLANARDFAEPSSAVRLRLEVAAGRARLSVENDGPALPAGDPARLFDSMVSHRSGDAAREPHLGLGLYVVGLVARFHRGRAFAETRAHGARVGIDVPLT